MAKNETEQKIIQIKPIKQVKAKITIVGDSPLIIHAWAEKAKKQMLDDQQKKTVAKKARAIRDPFAEFMDALYWMTEKPEESTPEAFEKAIAEGAKFGFPAIAIKEAATSACYRAGIVANQAGIKSAFRLNNLNTAESVDLGSELIEIESDEPPVLREDMVKIGGMTKTADLRYRPMFKNWKMKVLVTLNDVGTFSMESIINAINIGGAMCGIGEWRTERNGIFGSFHVETDGE